MQKKCNFAILRYQFALFQHPYACMRALCAIPNIYIYEKSTAEAMLSLADSLSTISHYFSLAGAPHKRASAAVAVDHSRYTALM